MPEKLRKTLHYQPNLFFMRNLESGPKDKFPEVVYVLLEIAKGSNQKYEVDKKSGLLFLDRDLFTVMVYPGDYGYIPQTLCADGDPVDALVLVSGPHLPGTVIPARPVAVMRMEDEKGMDDKILCVPDEKIDPTFKDIKDLKDVPEATIQKIKHFFEHMKELEPGKWVKVTDWHGAKEAKKFILDSQKIYEEKNK